VEIVVRWEKKGVLWAYSITVLMSSSKFGISFDPCIYPFFLLVKGSISVAGLKVVNKRKHDMDRSFWLFIKKLAKPSFYVPPYPVLHFFFEDGADDDNAEKEKKWNCNGKQNQ